MKLPLIIDNFAGGGGASTGLEAAFGRPVDVAINHDEAAIAVHSANHPETKHYCQSIFSVDPLDATGGASVLLAWFSPDCKHHSKAKGGKPRDRNIRDMAWVVPHWIERLQKSTIEGGGAPMVIMLENVEEFRQWGPLDSEGKPIKERKGEEFNLWVRRIRKLGYKVEHRELRACDYGAPTSRKRLFLIARRDGQPIVWPQPTHGRPDSVEVRTGKLLPWRTAAECIDWSIPCPSIFDRARDLKDPTCRRIATGVVRHVINDPNPFFVPLTHQGGDGRVYPGHNPLPTVTGAHRGEIAVISPGVVPITHTKGGNQVRPPRSTLPTITTSKGGEIAVTAASLFKLRNNCIGQDARAPIDTISTGGHFGVAAATLIQTGYGEREGQAPRVPHLGKPLGSVVAGGAKHAAVAAFMAQHNAGNGCAPKSMKEPLSTITGRGTQQQPVTVTLVAEGALPPDMMDRAVKVAAFLVKYYGSEVGQHQAANAPIDTITAKPRFAVVTVVIDELTYIIVDIGMRMLTPRELANAQGFPPDYILDPECWYLTEKGNRKFGRLPITHQIAKIGNSVCPVMSKVLASANLPEHCLERLAA
ncbi:MAG TPA: DNA cytosine methyltransferase [Sphingopyxis terrae]|nr:DNA cytosine methyltransferase [Sphingopyxis terrae]